MYYSLPWWFIQYLQTHSNYCDFILLFKKKFYVKTSLFIKNDCKIFYGEATIINLHCVKRVRIRSYSGPHFFSISRIRTEYGEILRISSVFSPNTGRCEKYADQNNSEYGNFLRSALLIFLFLYFHIYVLITSKAGLLYKNVGELKMCIL